MLIRERPPPLLRSSSFPQSHCEEPNFDSPRSDSPQFGGIATQSHGCLPATRSRPKRAAYHAAPKTADEKRARKSTANRIFNILKALLNRAYQDGLVASDSAWRKVKPFAKVDEARIRFLTDAEALRLVNACPADLRQLVRAGLLTGARFGELAGLQAKDVNLDTAQVYVSPAKSGRSRYVPLNDEGVTLFQSVVAGKTGDQLLFAKTSGEP